MASVERNADGAFRLIPDPGERVVWGLSNGVAIDVKTPTGYPEKAVRFLERPYVWFGTDWISHGYGEGENNPRQWRLYADGELVEGPKGYYAPNIHFPAWPEQPDPDPAREEKSE